MYIFDKHSSFKQVFDDIGDKIVFICNDLKSKIKLKNSTESLVNKWLLAVTMQQLMSTLYPLPLAL